MRWQRRGMKRPLKLPVLKTISGAPKKVRHVIDQEMY